MRPLLLKYGVHCTRLAVKTQGMLALHRALDLRTFACSRVAAQVPGAPSRLLGEYVVRHIAHPLRLGFLLRGFEHALLIAVIRPARWLGLVERCWADEAERAATKRAKF